MTTFILILILVLIVAIIISAVLINTMKTFREQKNYERGLKMVPLFIHLPPASDDIEGNGRDTRDVVEETISRAQTIYNIISSTVQSGMKTRLYGQRHFAFEVIATQGFIYFYAAVPVTMVDVVKQAIVSAYSSARLEEVVEHNIFSQVGKLTATIGGEMELKKSFAYPIATYQESKRDGMQALLNSLSTLSKEDGAAIQILMRPANEKWRDHSKELAEEKRTGHKPSKNGLAGEWAKSFGKAIFSLSGEKKEDDKKKKELSSLEQSNLDSIEEKTRYAGFETLIRIVVSSNLPQRSQAILSNITASFSVYNSPGKNGFKFVAEKDADRLSNDYLLRIFPQEKTHMVLNSIELASIFHFPDQKSIPTSQLSRQASKQVDGPREMPEDGLLLGYNLFRGAKKPIRLSLGDRQRHMYVVGQTGTGKSTFLEDLAFQDMTRGNGFAFVDPHGDTAERLLAMVPKERVEDVIYFCPGDMDYPMGLNLFEFQNPDQKDFLIQEALNMLYKLYDPNHSGIMGPRYENLFRNAALTIMADPQGGTFVDIPKLFRDPQFVKQKLQHVTDPTVVEFWEKEMPQSQRSNDFGEVVSWFVSKFGAFLSNEMMRNIIGQTKSAFDLRQVMDEKKILLVNLSKGRTGELNSKLLGMVFVMKFQAAAMSRANIPEDERVDFCLYVDEFQNFSTDSFATIMSEARKYHLNLIVANQFTTQLTDEVREAVFGNMGTIVSFRVGQNDVESLARYFQPTFEGEDLLRVPNYNSIVRTLIKGVPTHPFSMATLPPLGIPNPKLAEALKQLAAAKYGRPRGLVEKEIFARMETKPTTMPNASLMGPKLSTSPWQGAATGRVNTAVSSTGPPKGLAPPTNPGTGSFLDEWLSKKQQRTYNPGNNGYAGLSSSTAMPQTQPLPSNPSAPSSLDSFINQDDQSLRSPITPNNVPTTQPAQPPIYTGRSENISSEIVDRAEVDRIAQELENKSSLNAVKVPTVNDQLNVPPKVVPASSLSTSDIPINTAPDKKVLASEDTIYIDRDGNLSSVDQQRG